MSLLDSMLSTLAAAVTPTPNYIVTTTLAYRQTSRFKIFADISVRTEPVKKAAVVT